jgi:S-formylglutathione hydrolase FrmB
MPEMKTLILFFLLFLPFQTLNAQHPEGSVVVEWIPAPSLQMEQEAVPERRTTIYLPHGYNDTSERYPVIYYLHGFGWNDSLQVADDKFDKLLDKAIATGRIEPVIVVIPNHQTEFMGSFYTNSALTGNWADFTAYDVVQYVDRNYRTIPDRLSRGVSGHSMGGYGAIKFGMQFPEVFSSVYALSPASLALVKESGPKGMAYRRIQEIKTKEELLSSNSLVDFLALGLVAFGRAISPNPDYPPFYADVPYTYQGDSLKVNYDVLELWHAHLPLEMANDHVHNLKKLTALKFDWGRNEEFQFVPMGCKIFSHKLESLGVEHYAEEYIGTHANKLWTDDGRALNVMLPFFNRYLVFE